MRQFYVRFVSAVDADGREFDDVTAGFTEAESPEDAIAEANADWGTLAGEYDEETYDVWELSPETAKRVVLNPLSEHPGADHDEQPRSCQSKSGPGDREEERT